MTLTSVTWHYASVTLIVASVCNLAIILYCNVYVLSCAGRGGSGIVHGSDRKAQRRRWAGQSKVLPGHHLLRAGGEYISNFYSRPFFLFGEEKTTAMPRCRRFYSRFRCTKNQFVFSSSLFFSKIAKSSTQEYKAIAYGVLAYGFRDLDITVCVAEAVCCE